MHKVCTLAVATAMVLAAHGAAAQCCGDCSGDGEVTVDEILTTVNRALGGCEEDGICAGQSGGGLLATGQTESYGPGSDGDVQAGIPLAYRDNGDGTISDLNTGLMWEKKSRDGSIHDRDNRYTWGMDSAPYTMNGTMVTEFLATLNTSPCFAGHCDWRIPNRRELESIVDASTYQPAIDPVFHDNCVEGCRVTECSCTSYNPFHWTSTTDASHPGSAWLVYFFYGQSSYDLKTSDYNVRAVRGGL